MYGVCVCVGGGGGLVGREGSWVFASITLTVLWRAMYMTGHSDYLTCFHKPLSPAYRCHTSLKNISTILCCAIHCKPVCNTVMQLCNCGYNLPLVLFYKSVTICVICKCRGQGELSKSSIWLKCQAQYWRGFEAPGLSFTPQKLSLQIILQCSHSLCV